MRKLTLLEKRVAKLEAQLMSAQGALSMLSQQLNGSTTAPVANPVSKNSISFDTALSKLYVAKPDLSGWITLIG